ncbi:hypothetical protein LAUMK191_00829 [Mycobacterium attenuatum]|nr:hypothetical protein LAUMK191_00829 [Mycobacterium attenuatum]
MTEELCALMPNELDAPALAALVLLHDSRRATRMDESGALVPLEEQDRQRWDRGRIARGLDRLRQARGSTGPYLPQAVIAALHATAPSWEQTDWTTICAAYDRLVQLTNSPVILATPRWRLVSATGPVPVWRRWSRWPTIRVWPVRTWSPRCVPICCAAPDAEPKPSTGTERRWTPTVPSRAGHFCGAASPNAAAVPAEQTQKHPTRRRNRAFCVCSRRKIRPPRSCG